MNHIEYKALRQSVGSQARVAAALGLNLTTIQRRESGTFKITREAEIGMRHLADQVPVIGRLVGKAGRPKKLAA